MARLDDRIAVVTGGCSGIGEQIVHRFLDEGALVVVTDRQEPQGALADRIGDRLAYVRADITVTDELVQVFDVAKQRYGGLDILVNNAGAGGTTARIVDMDLDAWDAMFALLVRAPMVAIKHAAPMMAARGGGAIVNISSIAGLRSGLTAGAAYSVAKAAALKLTSTAALELASDRIRVNALLPGAVATTMFAGGLGLSAEEGRRHLPEVEAIYQHGQPLPVTGKPEHLASAAVFLASDEAAFITGVDIIVDGGLTLDPSVWKGAREKMIALGARLRAE
ncbi:MAG: SDR family oxidoreductase [Novosphingobium sp.]